MTCQVTDLLPTNYCTASSFDRHKGSETEYVAMACRIIGSVQRILEDWWRVVNRFVYGNGCAALPRGIRLVRIQPTAL